MTVANTDWNSTQQCKSTTAALDAVFDTLHELKIQDDVPIVYFSLDKVKFDWVNMDTAATEVMKIKLSTENNW